MSVDLRNFVQVNLNYHDLKPLETARDTAVLLSVNTSENAPYSKLNGIYKNSMQYWNKKGGDITDGMLATLGKFVDCFFMNGGIKLEIIGIPGPLYYTWNTINKDWNGPLEEEPAGGTELTLSAGDYYTTGEDPIVYHLWDNTNKVWEISGSAGTTNITDNLVAGVYYELTSITLTDDNKLDWMYEQCKALDPNKILVMSDCNESLMERLIQKTDTTDIVGNAIDNSTTVITLSGYKEKMFISSTNDANIIINDNIKKYDNYAIKFGAKGIESTIPAYLTQVKLNNAKSIADYCFTPENLSMFEEGETTVVDDNSTIVDLANKNINLCTNLVNEIRNVYGDTISGRDLMNHYMKIILTQTLTNRIINALVSKIKFDKSGINKITNAITQELDVYKNNGYLTTDAVIDEDIYYHYNNVDYLICKRNTPLISGYRFIILPLTSLTPTQKEQHILPPVYVVYSDATGIRHVVVQGDIY